MIRGLMTGLAVLAVVWSSGGRYATYTARGTDGVTYTWNNDRWADTAGPQVIWVNGNNDWGVTSTQVFSTRSWVEAYPHIGWRGGRRLTAYPAVTATFAETGPGHVAPLRWEAAFDIWLNASSPGADNGYEVMVWTDVSGVSPGGSVLATPLIGGIRYRVYQGAGNNGPGMTTLVQVANTASGTRNLRAILSWVTAFRGAHPLPAGSVLSTVEFGWEVWGTGGRPARFHVSHYTMSFLREDQDPGNRPSGATCTGRAVLFDARIGGQPRDVSVIVGQDTGAGHGQAGLNCFPWPAVNLPGKG